MKKISIPLLAQILIAIILGIICSYFFPEWLNRLIKTINNVFSTFLGFVIPLLIVGLIAPGIFELGKGAGKLLFITAATAYLSTIFAGFFSFITCQEIYPHILTQNAAGIDGISNMESNITPYFTLSIPPVMDIMSALVLAFLLGIGLSTQKGETFKNILVEFRHVIMRIIERIIIPFLPFYIFGIFLLIGVDGQIGSVLNLFFKVIVVIFAIHIVFLLLQFCIAGIVVKQNPLKMLWNMMPAYVTALGTQSSAATIPITLAQTKKNGVRHQIADFVIPLCATIHLAGSTLKIVACAYAISYMFNQPIDLALYAGFILMLGVSMIAAPGVPGGAIMAAIGIIGSMLGFDVNLQAIMIALYIAMDSFGTACNVTGDGAIAVILDRIYKK